MKRTYYWLLLIVLIGVAIIAGVFVQKPNVSSDLITRIAEAIALAEGFYMQGSRPQKNNNPGDLEMDLISRGVGYDGPIVKFSNADDGWQSLEKQVSLFYGGSAHYNPSMTIAEVSVIYTGGDNAGDWARIVASKLGVTPDTRLQDLV